MSKNAPEIFMQKRANIPRQRIKFVWMVLMFALISSLDVFADTAAKYMDLSRRAEKSTVLDAKSIANIGVYLENFGNEKSNWTHARAIEVLEHLSEIDPQEVSKVLRNTLKYVLCCQLIAERNNDAARITLCKKYAGVLGGVTSMLIPKDIISDSYMDSLQPLEEAKTEYLKEMAESLRADALRAGLDVDNFN